MFGLFAPAPAPTLQLPDGAVVPVRFRPHRKARKYIVRVGPDGGVEITLPRSGSKRFALDFARKQAGWIVRQRAHAAGRNQAWGEGHPVLYRGERFPLAVVEEEGRRLLACGDLRLRLPAATDDFRPAVLKAFRAEAARDLPARVARWTGTVGAAPARVVVRDQRTLWGSCSARRTVSLNWRLVQAPPWVADYIVVHELVHLIEMNHSARYWKRVADAFPRWEEAERWLKENREALR